MHPVASPIEDYLDQLVITASSLAPRDLRQLLAEAEAHLRDSAAECEAAGLSEFEAEADAVRRFGPADQIVAAERDRLATPLSVVIRQFVATAWLLGAIGALAVGVSGLLALAVRIVGGARLLVNAPRGADLTSSNCARWLAADPGAPNCRAAAISDWVYEVVGYRLVAGVVGLIALLLFVGLRRRRLRVSIAPTLPPAVSDTIALTAFAAAGAWTLGMGVDALVVSSGDGSGQWLSAAPVALAAAAVFGARLVRDLRHQVS